MLLSTAAEQTAMLLTAAGREAAWLCVHQQSQECGHVRSLATTLTTEAILQAAVALLVPGPEALSGSRWDSC